MEEVLLETIADIQARKRLANERPDHVLFYRGLLPELQERITKCLDGMVETGKIKRSRTVNDTAYGND